MTKTMVYDVLDGMTFGPPDSDPKKGDVILLTIRDQTDLHGEAIDVTGTITSDVERPAGGGFRCVCEVRQRVTEPLVQAELSTFRGMGRLVSPAAL